MATNIHAVECADAVPVALAQSCAPSPPGTGPAGRGGVPVGPDGVHPGARAVARPVAYDEPAVGARALAYDEPPSRNRPVANDEPHGTAP